MSQIAPEDLLFLEFSKDFGDELCKGCKGVSMGESSCQDCRRQICSGCLGDQETGRIYTCIFCTKIK
jgi:hypothetical protein